ncbi:galactose oxidase [Pedobacter yulinensis]|uniref:Galactose oxidase n=1 Tax=Pedobacter yulinensis TaxID=2126353 RepID=A0A2T3HHY4_9SPHI|nr:kelch repeat-containing protein [Pedobacter yulinensis]PST82058.1 galactose oxidase [Pedobacter yulinensis]
MILSTTTALAQQPAAPAVRWLPPVRLVNEDGRVAAGVAGAVSGIHREVFLLAGGANFPEKMPWEGGKKHYSDEIHVFVPDGPGLKAAAVRCRLSQAVAYAGSTSTPEGIVYAGGENEAGLSGQAYLLRWEPRQRQVAIKRLPDLPLALTNTALVSIGHTVYAAGGDGALVSSATFLSLDLRAARPEWQPLPDLPVALANTVLVAQKSGDRSGIFLIGGRTKTLTGISKLHGSVYFFDTQNNTWEQRAAVSDEKTPMNLSAGTGLAVGPDLILLAGGDRGEVFHKIETFLAAIAAAKTPEEKERLTREKNELVINHQGFFRGMLLYNTRKDCWTSAGELPFPAQVTTTARFWGEKIILPSGEIRPGVRTPDINIGTIE